MLFRSYGGADNEHWTQNIYGNKYEMWNPIRQNEGHIRVLRHMLQDINPLDFISIVTFSRRASLDIRNCENVVYWDDLNDVIRSYHRKWLSTEQARAAYETLLAANIDSRDNQQEHIRNMETRIAEREETIAHGHCPRCGGQLILRKGSYGPFYWCSNYPRCRFPQTTMMAPSAAAGASAGPLSCVLSREEAGTVPPAPSV